MGAKVSGTPRVAKSCLARLGNGGHRPSATSFLIAASSGRSESQYSVQALVLARRAGTV